MFQRKQNCLGMMRRSVASSGAPSDPHDEQDDDDDDDATADNANDNS